VLALDPKGSLVVVVKNKEWVAPVDNLDFDDVTEFQLGLTRFRRGSLKMGPKIPKKNWIGIRMSE
jgi:hypothetical protein